MALKVSDRIKQFTTSTGTGGVSFTGTPTGFSPFSSALSNGELTYYGIEENDKWEVGIGTYGSDNMVRSHVIASSNGGSHINLGGSGVVFITYPADKSVYRNEESQIVVGASGLLFDTGTVLKDFNLGELSDVSISGTAPSNTVLGFNNTNSSVVLGGSTGASNSNNILIGYGAASGITSASNITVVGQDAGIANTHGNESVSIGTLSGPSELFYANPAHYSVSVGYKAGSRTRTHATSIGYQAGVAAYEHGFVAVGSAAGSGIGSYSVGVGYEAAHGDSSDYVVAVGHQAAKGSSGQSAVWIGNMAGISSSSSTRSIGLGYQAGKSSSAEDSIYIGSSAGQSNTTDDLLYIGNGPPSSNRTLIKGDMQSKRVAIGAADVALNDTLLVGIAASTDKGLVVKSAAGQSANITEWQNFAGNTTASVDTNGDITANELAASGQGLHLHNLGAPPPTTSNRLYNYGGSLYFNLVPMSAPSGINTSVAFYGPGQSAVYSNDFTFDKSDVELTVGSVKIQQDAIEIDEPGNTIRLGKYTIAPAIADSPYSIFLGMNAGVFASGLTSSVLLGHNAGWGMSDSYRSVAVGMQAGFYASGDRSIYLGENAGSRASGVHNVFIGYDAGRYCVGDQNIEIVASGESNSVLDGYSNKIHIGQTVIGDTDAKKLAFGLVSSGNVSPDATVEVFPKTDDLALKVHGSGEFASGIVLPSAVPSTTSNMLYNDAGTLKFNGTILGDATTTQLNYVSGVAVYASGQSIANESDIATNTTNIATNADNIVATSGIANYASGLAITNQTNIATNTSNISTNTSNISTNAGDIVATSGIADYASGQAISNEADIATNVSNISTNTSNIAINANDIIATSGIANYASGQVALDSDNVAAVSGIANYASGQSIANEDDIVATSGIAAYASGQADASNLQKVTDRGATTTNNVTVNNLLIADGGTIGSASENNVLTIAADGNVTFVSGVIVDGNLTVRGDEVILDVQKVEVEDNTILLNKNVTGTPSLNAGLEIERGTSPNTVIRWNESSDIWDFTQDGTNYYEIGKYEDINAASGIANYASGQAIENESAIATNVSNIATNADDIVAVSGISHYASGLAITNETDIVATSGIANYASGQAIANESDIVATSGIAAYSSGQAIDNETDLVYVSGAAAYASGNTANIAFGSNAEGDLLYHNGTSFIRLAKGANDYILKMNGNVPNWEAESGGISWDGSTANGVATFKNSSEATVESNLTFDGNTLTVATSSNSVTPSVIKGASSQTADLTSWQTSTGSVVAAMTASGTLNAYGVVASGDLTLGAGFATESTTRGIISNINEGTGNTDTYVYVTHANSSSQSRVGASNNTGSETVSIYLINSSPEGGLNILGENVISKRNTGALKFNPSYNDMDFVFYPDAGSANPIFFMDSAEEKSIFGGGNADLDGQLGVKILSATDAGITIKGAAAQSADLTSWQNSAGTSVAAMTASGTLNAYGIVASGDVEVSSSSLTPFSVDAGGRTGNSNFVLKTGTGATDNQAILQVLGGTAGESRLYLGDSAVPAKAQLWYNNSNERFFLSANGATRMCIDENGRYMFSNRASSGGAGPPSVGYIDVVANNGTIMCSGVRGHLLDNGTTDGTTQFDISQSTVHKITLDQDATFSVTNDRAGDRFMIRVLQDGTGGHSVTWWSGISWAGNVVPTLSAANKADLLGFLCTGTNTYDGFIVGQDI